MNKEKLWQKGIELGPSSADRDVTNRNIARGAMNVVVGDKQLIELDSETSDFADDVLPTLVIRRGDQLTYEEALRRHKLIRRLGLGPVYVPEQQQPEPEGGDAN